ncbi:MAG: aminotransferase class I/II-fold pyridoxal phosphate-dependent enzyme, partial [Pseudomonadota bacterium]
NSPANPTGAVYSAEELQALADVLRAPDAQHVHILCDDIYEHVLYEGEFATIAQIAPDLKERTLTLNGLSKSYCMTGWRIGYAAGAQDLIKAITKIQGQSVTSPTTMCQWAAIAALQGDQSFIATHNAHFKHRRDKIVAALNVIDGITCMIPPGAFYVYPNCAGLIGKTTLTGKTIANDEDFCTYLLEEAQIAVVHGAAFGLSPHFRISYAASDDAIANACSRLVDACNLLT